MTNPIEALRQAWHEVEREYKDDAREDVPDEVVRAQESMDALRELRDSFSNITREKKRLRKRAQ